MAVRYDRKQQRREMRFCTRFLIALLRPFYRQKLIGAEKLKLDEDIPCIFVCNHGEISGPVVTTLYMPFAYRPWVTHEVLERDAIVDQVCNGALKYRPILGHKADRFVMTHFGGPLAVKVMSGVDPIPVYRDDPRKLVKTFRETAAAMKDGSNILVFPEDTSTEPDGRYVREGVSKFYTGFTLIAQLYYNQTGNCPLFVPIYISRKDRTMTFCTPIRYRPEDTSAENKEMLCKNLRDEMLEAAGRKK